ncbi:MAG: nucleotidyltransferase domain-containing protein [Crenarchaeota archaeon]|nr:nucleotidyltransferase domain-containing protein [Thermoproteota archaeon]MDW8033979.1 nucleotidyltransferase domain-containing protein [Nitrososphaerota archaeon]
MRTLVVEEKLIDAVFRLASKMGLRINSIILFGSYARMENLQWSDVDLLIISDDFSSMSIENRVRLVLEKWDYEKPVEPVCLAPEEVSESNPLLWEICRDGIAIMDDGTFTKLRTKCLKHFEQIGIQRLEYGYIMRE